MPIEAPEGRSLPNLLVPALRTMLLKLDRGQAAMTYAKRGLGALARFVKAFKLNFGELEASIDLGEVGVADNGDLETDLGDLLDIIGAAAAERGTAAVLFIDELQYVPEAEFAALITALHRTRQNDRPVALVGAGLPQLVGLAGRAKSYEERLFIFESIDALDREPALAALSVPAAGEGVHFTTDALDRLFALTRGYPYFLQEWGKESWDAATASPITLADVERATPTAIAALDASFFRVRFDRLTPAEKIYLRALAAQGEGPYAAASVAQSLGRPPKSFGPVRSTLIAKGMIYVPTYGQTAFTVPLFDDFMRRTMPAADPV